MLLDIGYLIAEAMVLQLHRMRQLFVLLAAGLPILLLPDVRSRYEDAIFVLAAVLDRLLDDLG